MRLDLVSGHDARMTLVQGADGLIATLNGTVDADFLTQALAELHDEALSRRHPGVTLDVSRAAPMDPPAVKAVIKWAMRQAELEDGERYAVVLRYSEGVSWQKVSLEAIAHLCPYVKRDPIA